MYKFIREEILSLLVQAYNKGKHGTLGRAEVIAEKLLEDKCEETNCQLTIGTDIGNGNVKISSSIDTSLFRATLDAIPKINLEDTNNLVIINSDNSMDGTHWLPYPEINLITEKKA